VHSRLRDGTDRARRALSCHDACAALDACIDDANKSVVAVLNDARNATDFEPMHQHRVIAGLRGINARLVGCFALRGELDTKPACIQRADALFDLLFGTVLLEHATTLGWARPMHTYAGKFLCSQLVVLVLAALDDALMQMRAHAGETGHELLCAAHMPEVRRAGLAVDAETPIAQYSAHTLMRSLHAVYVRAPEITYSPGAERYTLALLQRARALLFRPAGAGVHDVAALREQLAADGDALFRYSPLYLRDVALLHYALAHWFDAVHVAGARMDAPPQPSERALDAVRAWLRRHATEYVDRVVQAHSVRMTLRPGETELFAANTPGEEASEHEIMRRHRLPDFLRATERALHSTRRVICGALDARAPQDVVFGLAVLSVFVQRLSAANAQIDAEHYVVLGDAVFGEAGRLRTSRAPLLVLCFNRVQLCLRGTLYMYNDALAAVAAWMEHVDGVLGGVLGGLDVRALVDECLYAHEGERERAARRGGGRAGGAAHVALFDVLKN